MSFLSRTRSLVWVLAVFLLAISSGCHRETDDELIAKVNAGVAAGNFCGRAEVVDAVSTLYSRGNAKAHEPVVVDCLITSGATLLTDSARWTKESEARQVYDLLKKYEGGEVVNGLVRKVVTDAPRRLHVLFLGVKLGIAGSEQRLNQALDEHGDKQMAEDYLNSGSSELHEGGRRWSEKHGYHIKSGMGSHRASWGRF